jgi:hypothetical protein
VISSPRPRSLKKSILAASVFLVLPVVVACGEKHKVVVVDAGPVATAPAVDAAPLSLEEDAGVDAADAADAAKKPGVAINTNVARLRQCCGQLRTQARAMGASPEAGMLIAAAAQCDTMAAQAAPGASAPELGLLRTALAGRNVPPVCSGF